MKLLWVNPSFLDYRIPLYKKINEKLNGEFSLVYSKFRIPERCINKIEDAIGENAKSVKLDKQISIGGTGEFANKGIKIPVTKGLYSLIKSTRPDIIIAEGFFKFTPLTVLYSFVHNKPLLIAYERTAHTERTCPSYRRWYRKFINLFVSGYVVNGSLTKEYLISQGVKPEVIFTGAMCADSIGLSRDVASLNADDKILIKSELIGEQSNGLIYIYVGQIINRKGVNYLLEAWKKHIETHKNDKLLIIGDGPLLDEYKKQHTHSSVIFTGVIDYSEIHKYYAISDVFVIPTLEDNWSLVVPEAMACGLPIACSIYNGCHPELVKEGVNGKTFDPLKKESVMEVLEYFHGKDLKEMGRKSIEIEQSYSPDSTAENIINAVKCIYKKKIV